MTGVFCVMQRTPFFIIPAGYVRVYLIIFTMYDRYVQVYLSIFTIFDRYVQVYMSIFTSIQSS